MQALTTFVSNAHTYTLAGGTIGVTVSRQGEEVRVDVRDTGIGMSSEEVGHLFSKF